MPKFLSLKREKNIIEFDSSHQSNQPGESPIVLSLMVLELILETLLICP